MTKSQTLRQLVNAGTVAKSRRDAATRAWAHVPAAAVLAFALGDWQVRLLRRAYVLARATEVTMHRHNMIERAPVVALPRPSWDDVQGPPLMRPRVEDALSVTDSLRENDVLHRSGAMRAMEWNGQGWQYSWKPYALAGSVLVGVRNGVGVYAKPSKFEIDAGDDLYDYRLADAVIDADESDDFLAGDEQLPAEYHRAIHLPGLVEDLGADAAVYRTVHEENPHAPEDREGPGMIMDVRDDSGEVVMDGFASSSHDPQLSLSPRAMLKRSTHRKAQERPYPAVEPVAEQLLVECDGVLDYTLLAQAEADCTVWHAPLDALDVWLAAWRERRRSSDVFVPCCRVLTHGDREQLALRNVGAWRNRFWDLVRSTSLL